ncbi:hypothetical protein [Neisseria meningitidis]|uniref:hypothetical protein n=1 Tax=Neisseria meningitidis TaxID=487 RepID=UPI0013DEBC85|nr:hypothetical protein [Neisseria meningitidis]
MKKTGADGSRAAPSASDYKPPPAPKNSKMPSEGLGLLKKRKDFPVYPGWAFRRHCLLLVYSFCKSILTS